MAEANALTDRENARRRLAPAPRLPQLERIEGEVTPHTLRHTAATWVVANGTPFEKAADFLGMSVETLVRVYRHHAPGFRQEAADAIVRKPLKRSTI